MSGPQLTLLLLLLDPPAAAQPRRSLKALEGPEGGHQSRHRVAAPDLFHSR